MNLSFNGINATGVWTVLSWIAAVVLHFTGTSSSTQQVVDAVTGLVTAAHVGGTHYVKAQTSSGKGTVS